MSILKNFMKTPKFMWVLMSPLVISFIDVLGFTDATSVSEMTWWGQISFYSFLLGLSGVAIKLAILPLVGWFINLFKKK